MSLSNGEGAVKVASSVVDVFRASPLLLLVILLNVILVGFGFWMIDRIAQRAYANQKEILEHCLYVKPP